MAEGHHDRQSGQPAGNEILSRRERSGSESAEGIQADHVRRADGEGLRLLCEAATEGVFIHDRGTILAANPALAALSGYEVAELVGLDGLTLVTEESRATVWRNIVSGCEEPCEVQGLRKDGTEIPLEIRGRTVLYEGRSVRAVAVRDIAERKQAEEALREQEAKYRSFFENVRDVFYRTDMEGIITEISPSVEGYGYARDELIGTQVLDIYEDPESRAHLVKTLVENREVIDYEVRLKTGDGRVADASVGARLVLSEDGTPVAIEGSLRDITERKRAERALRESESRYRTLIETSPDAITLTDLSSNIVMVNRQAIAVHGCETADDMIGRSAMEFVDPQDRQRAAENAAAALRTGSVRNIEYRLLRKDGSRFPAELSASLVSDGEGNPEAFIGVVRDISERKHFEDRLVHLANHDPLTRLFNRRRFQEELETQLALAERYDTGGALLFLDLDDFKDINDTLGHLAGDELLAGLARLLRDRLRDSDIVSRAGGDEFAVFLPHADREQALEVAGMLLSSIQGHIFQAGGSAARVTASIGIALYPEHGLIPEDLLSRADLAMYQAKEQGPNRVSVCAGGMDWHAEVESRLGWQHRIRDALEHGLFCLYAQPILDLHSGSVPQHELLLRLRSKDGVIEADSFIGIAERSGMINAIDRWVISQAVRLIAAQRRAGRAVRLEVNLSGKAFADNDLYDFISRELEARSVEPTSLVLEVTETAAIANIAQAQSLIARLKGLGCQFALDDFGVGFSSFYHLKHLPVDYLKIDGSFIRDLPHSPVDQHLVQAIVQVATGLGKKTIAEFVGNDETVQLLRELGADYAQGYHIGRPRDVAEGLAIQESAA